jgi:beta-glucanase (GH16 family)
MKVLLLAGTLLISACGGDEEEEEIQLPANLQVNLNLDQIAQGRLDVAATADNARFYTIDFGEPESQVIATDGKASHTYENGGTFTILVKAHANNNTFISSSQVVVVPEPPIVDEGYTTSATYDGFALVWQDEFNGSALSPESWTFETGTGSGGWGNNELQYYRQENTSLKDGFLVITAKKESFGGANYTSSRIITKGKQKFKYGRMDIRAKLPRGQGLWPALWMLGENISTVGWPACGEIDIMEMVGGAGREKTVHGTLHWEENGHKCTCDKPGYSLASGTFSDKFHVFTLTWDKTYIRWYVDDVLFNTIDITPAALSEFHNEHFFIFNVAVGGNWPGSPNDATQFPQKMIVDYIRVFQPD